MFKALVLQLTPPSEATAITVQTALLLIVAALLAVVLKELLHLRRRVTDLESHTRHTAASGDRLNSAGASVRTNTPDRINGDTVAVISAAVHLVCELPHRIVSISAPPPEHQQAWSAEGRRQVFQSHRVR